MAVYFFRKSQQCVYLEVEEECVILSQKKKNKRKFPSIDI